MSLNDYHPLLVAIERLRRPKVEKNVFSLGGKGHYENPITDLLAFFIHPKEEHGLGLLFVQSLFEAAGLQPPTLQLAEKPAREIYTGGGNRIDLLVEGDDWVLVVENKIRHQPVNPFEDYREYVSKTYGSKKHYYLMLSVQDSSAPPGWRGVTWKSYVDRIKANMGAYWMSERVTKWNVIAREFLLNIESEYRSGAVSEDRIDFVKNNYGSFLELKDMLSEYVAFMCDKGQETIRAASNSNSEEKTFSKQHDWGEEGLALRLYSTDWGGKTNIVLLLRKDGSLVVRFYVYDIDDVDVDTLRNRIDHTKYEKFWTELKTIRCFGFFRDIDHDRIFEEIKEVAFRLNAFYSAHKKP